MSESPESPMNAALRQFKAAEANLGKPGPASRGEPGRPGDIVMFTQYCLPVLNCSAAH